MKSDRKIKKLVRRGYWVRIAVEQLKKQQKDQAEKLENEAETIKKDLYRSYAL